MSSNKPKLDKAITISDILDKATFKLRDANPEIKQFKFHKDILELLKKFNGKFENLGIEGVDDFQIGTLTSLHRNFCKPLLESGIYEENDFGIKKEELDDIVMKAKGEIALELNPEKIEEIISFLEENKIEKWSPKTLLDLYSETSESKYKNLYDWFRVNVRRNYFSSKNGKISTTVNWKYIVKKISDFSEEGKKIAENFEQLEEYYTLSSAIDKLFLVLKKEKIEKWSLKYLHENRRGLYEFFNSYMKKFGEEDFSFVLNEMKIFEINEKN